MVKHLQQQIAKAAGSYASHIVAIEKLLPLRGYLAPIRDLNALEQELTGFGLQ